MCWLLDVAVRVPKEEIHLRQDTTAFISSDRLRFAFAANLLFSVSSRSSSSLFSFHSHCLRSLILPFYSFHTLAHSHSRTYTRNAHPLIHFDSFLIFRSMFIRVTDVMARQTALWSHQVTISTTHVQAQENISKYNTSAATTSCREKQMGLQLKK